MAQFQRLPASSAASTRPSSSLGAETSHMKVEIRAAFWPGLDGPFIKPQEIFVGHQPASSPSVSARQPPVILIGHGASLA